MYVYKVEIIKPLNNKHIDIDKWYDNKYMYFSRK